VAAALRRRRGGAAAGRPPAAARGRAVAMPHSFLALIGVIVMAAAIVGSIALWREK
jgi:hypothetical protein